MSRPVVVDIALVWGDTVVSQIHLDPVRDVTLGEQGCDLSVPESKTGIRSAKIIVLGTDGTPLLVVPHGSEAIVDTSDGPARKLHGDVLPITQGSRIYLRFDDVELTIEGELVDTSQRATITRGRDWRAVMHVAGSALVHAAIAAGIVACAHAYPADPKEAERDRLMMITHYLNASAEREQESFEASTPMGQSADNKEGGVGTRARGEEGAMGRDSNKRFGIAGPHDQTDPHIARSQALREAAEFGMIGLLNTGAGGDPAGSSNQSGFGRGGFGFGSGHGALHSRGTDVAAETPLDPNGRFATTYRPGRGYLSGFESALARGVFPPATRELVSDIGASYAPSLTPDPDKSLAMETALERSKLAPSGGPMHLRVALQSASESARLRPHLSVHLVLDVSGSMSGDPITRAKQAAEMLVDRLAPTDDFSLVSFSDTAQVLMHDSRVGPNRGAIKSAIRKAEAGGGTNIHAGLSLGYSESRDSQIPQDAERVVLLLSDGRANAGLTARSSLTGLALEAFQSGVQTTTFGLGSDYDGELMSALASDGAGAYYYLRDSEQIGSALTSEIDRRLDPAASAVEIRVRVAPDLQVLSVYGSRRLSDLESAQVRSQEVAADTQAERRHSIQKDRQEDKDGGMRFFLPAFARDDRYALLIKLNAPSGAEPRNAGIVELRYKDRIHGRNVVQEVPLQVGYARSDAESAASINPSVTRTIQGFLAGESLMRAAERMDRGDSVGAASILGERESILREVSKQMADTTFLVDASRFARMRELIDERVVSREPKALAMLLETAARSHLR